MVEKAQITGAPAAPKDSPAASPPTLGSPGSDIRWLLPILLCAGVLALVLFVAVLMPMRHAANVEPDPVIKAVLSDNLFVFQIRLWIILLMAALLGGAMAVAGARQNAKALVRLELRLRNIADGEAELPATDPKRDFAQFDEVFAYLRAGMDRTTRRNRSVLQQVQRPLRTLMQQVAAGKATPDEQRKILSAVLQEVDAVLDADRRAGAGRPRLE